MVVAESDTLFNARTYGSWLGQLPSILTTTSSLLEMTAACFGGPLLDDGTMSAWTLSGDELAVTVDDGAVGEAQDAHSINTAAAGPKRARLMTVTIPSVRANPDLGRRNHCRPGCTGSRGAVNEHGPDPGRVGRPDGDPTGSVPAARYREAVYVLLPPSETKHPGGTGPPLDLASLKFPELTVIRRQLIDELVSLSSNVEASVAALNISSGRPGHATAGGRVISPLLRDQVISNGLLSFAPTMPALLRYTGVLYAAMNDPALSRPELARADERVLITSALFGILGGGDLIPPYRMSAAAHLTGLPSMAVLWRSRLATALAGITGPVLDLRSGAYAAFAPMPGAISVRVLTMTLVLKSTRAVGRANLENIRPLAIATPRRPTKASNVTRTAPTGPFGDITP